MLGLIISAGIVLFTYLIFVRIKTGIFPKSISDSFYVIKKQSNITWPFLAFLAYAAATLVIIGYDTWNIDDGLPLLAIAGLGIFAVTTFACFYNSAVKILHYIAAISGFSVAAFSFWFNYDMWWWTVAIATVTGLVTYITRNKNPIWWLEVTLSTMLLGGLVFLYI